jgi:hypothetical protein
MFPATKPTSVGTTKVKKVVQKCTPECPEISSLGLLAQVRHGGVDFGHFRAWPEQK